MDHYDMANNHPVPQDSYQAYARGGGGTEHIPSCISAGRTSAQREPHRSTAFSYSDHCRAREPLNFWTRLGSMADRTSGDVIGDLYDR